MVYGHRARLLTDSGASGNFISDKYARGEAGGKEGTSFEVHTGDTSCTFVMGDGSSHPCNQVARVAVAIDGRPRRPL